MKKIIFTCIFLSLCNTSFALNGSLSHLDQKIRDAGIPIDGVALIDSNTHETRIDFKQEATKDQKDQAQQIVDNFDWSEKANDVSRIDSMDITAKELAGAVTGIVQDSSGFLELKDNLTEAKIKEKIKQQKIPL